MKTPQEKITLAKTQILLRKKLRVFGCILFKFDIDTVDDPQGTAYCYVQNKKPHIRFSEQFIDTLNQRQVLFVLLHEVMHIIENHLGRCQTRDQMLFNIAADFNINGRLYYDAKNDLNNLIEMPPIGVLDTKLSDENLLVEEIYDRLFDQIEKIKQKYKDMMQDLQPDMGDGDGAINDPGEMVSVSNEIKSTIQAAISSGLVQKGDMSSKIAVYLDEITQIELPWDEILQKVINSTIVPSPESRTWSRPNKKLRHLYTLPGEGKIEEYQYLYLVIDCSGSVSKSDLKKFLSVIENSANHFNFITVIQHDTDIYVKTYESHEVMNGNDEIRKITKRGGTSHKDAFDYIERQFIEGAVDESIDLIICLTDFESDIEVIWNNYEWTSELPFKVVCNSKHSRIPEHIDDQPIFIK